MNIGTNGFRALIKASGFVSAIAISACAARAEGESLEGETCMSSADCAVNLRCLEAKCRSARATATTTRSTSSSAPCKSIVGSCKFGEFACIEDGPEANFGIDYLRSTCEEHDGVWSLAPCSSSGKSYGCAYSASGYCSRTWYYGASASTQCTSTETKLKPD